MHHLAFLTLACVISLALPATAAEPVLAEYRGNTLGDSLQAVADRMHLALSDVKTVHARPALVQELTWRPSPFINGTPTRPDSIGELVLTFHAGRLARMVVIYDRERTQGLTNADVHDAVSGVYGTSILMATPIQRPMSQMLERQTFGRWEDAETLVLLWREQFPNRVGLTITSIAGDALLQQAITDGVQLHADEGPAREVARRAADLAAIAARDEKIRLDNKTKFKP